MSEFNDVWSRIDRAWVCPYCAEEILPSDNRANCPRCGRPLTIQRLARKKPSSNFYIYLIVIFGLAQILLVETIFGLISGNPAPTIVATAIWIPVIFLLVPFLFWRKFSAYILSILLLIALTAQFGLFYIVPNFAVLEGSEQGTPLEGLYDGFYAYSSGSILSLLWLAIAVGFALALFFVAPDFAREKRHILATVPSDLFRQSSASAHLLATRIAEQDKWAQAVIYWRRAIAADPSRLLFYLHLSDAYRRIGYDERALDTLDSAEPYAQTEQGKLKLEELRVKIPKSPNSNKTA